MIARLQKELFSVGVGPEIDGAIVVSPVNRRYLTGFPSSYGVLLITVDRAYLLLDFRYAEAAQRSVKNCEVVLFTSMADTLRDLVRKNHLKRIALEYEHLSLRQAKNLETILSAAGASTVEDETLDQCITSLRMIKTPEEISKLKAAQKITDDAFSFVLGQIHPGITEREIALKIEFFMREHGADGAAFDLIVVSGKNGSLCHGIPSEKMVESGDFVTMDIGALLDGYHSDMTRTVAVGFVSTEQRRAYETVLCAQLAAIDTVRDGVSCAEVDLAARRIIEEEYPGAFGHATGHGVGLDIHEEPRFSSNSKTIARAGMVVSVEPGVYLPGKFGLRIEDLVVVTKDGCENLTHSSKELIIL